MVEADMKKILEERGAPQPQRLRFAGKNAYLGRPDTAAG
jgi:hypothetical protein